MNIFLLLSFQNILLPLRYKVDKIVPEKINDWLFGGQIFADLIYKIIWFSIGVNAKYQITQSFKDTDFDLSNYKLDAHIGIIIK